MSLLNEGQKTRRAAEIVARFTRGPDSFIGIDHLKEAAIWRIACLLADTDTSVEDALEELKALRLQ